MWFSPLKGAHLTLGQLDKTLPVNMGYTPSGSTEKINEKIRRGSFVFIKAGTTGKDAPSFQLYTSAEAAKPNAVPYIALMSVYDFQAGMAGNVGQAPEVEEAAKYGSNPGSSTNEAKFLGIKLTDGAQAFEGPRITAISVVQPAEYQTSAFEDVEGYYVGAPLTISNDGKLTPFPEAGGKNIVGYVTAIPKTRWINNLGDDATGARITGGNAKVLEFSTAWIPVAATATAGTGGAGTNPGVLNVGKPQVQAPAQQTQAAKPAAPAANTQAK